MGGRHPLRAVMIRLLAVALSLLVTAPAAAQVWVAPRRAGQSAVRYDQHQWRSIDLLVGEELDGHEAGGVRLLFYEDEREVAERAAAQIAAAYHQLAEDFGYVPERRFPYILYNSYAEFLRTNLFPLQEGVLGVTSTRSLELTLPYFGDPRLFEEVSTHEMAHQFTIQKVRSAAAHAEAGRDPLPYLPLWFVEGLAEYYAQGGLDDRAAMLVRDIVTNPDLFLGHGMLGFYDDFPWSVLWTYQVGLARVVFLEETYGDGTVQALLEGSPWLGHTTSAFVVPGKRFSALVQRITGDDAQTVDAKFDAWIKRRTYEQWLSAEQSAAAFEPLRHVRGSASAFDASDDGGIVAYRSVERETGRSRLLVAPAAQPERVRRIAAEGKPGTESLHPVDPRNFDVAEGRIAWVAESRGSDVLWLQELTLRTREPRRPPPKTEAPPAPLSSDEPFAVTDWALQHPATPDDADGRSFRVRKGRRERHRMARHGIRAIYSPSLGPDGRVAFVGLHDDGRKDIFVFDPRADAVRRLTDDAHAERAAAWHGDHVVYTSDATSHGRFNLFRVPVAGGAAERLTTEPHDHLSPVSLPDGRLFFVAWRDGRANLHELVGGEVHPRTDFSIGLFEPAPGPDDSLWAVMHRKGGRSPVRLDDDALLDGSSGTGRDDHRSSAAESFGAEVPRPARSQEIARPQPAGLPAAELPRLDLSDAMAYKPLAPRNWRPESIFGVSAAGPGGLFGQVFASATDVLRDRALVFSGFFLGSFELTDGYVLYLDQSRRVTWGGGPFQSLRFRIDRTLHPDLVFQSAERFYGGMLSARIPGDRFLYVQVDQAVGATSYFLFNGVDDVLADPVANGTGQDLLTPWQAQWSDVRPQTETTLRVGFDTVRYHYKTGPVAGGSLLLEANGGLQPFHGARYGHLRADLQAYVPLPLGSGANLGFKASGGTSGGGDVARGFFLSSYDTLRGAHYGDWSVLLGRHFAFASSELQVPLDAVVRVAMASTVEGVVGVDVGAVADRPDELWDRRILDVALGGNLVLGPMLFRVHFARALDVGAPMPVPDAPNRWVPNVSLTWLQL